MNKVKYLFTTFSITYCPVDAVDVSCMHPYCGDCAAAWQQSCHSHVASDSVGIAAVTSVSVAVSSSVNSLSR